MAHARNGDVELFYETFGDPADPALLLINGLGSQCINYKREWCEMFVAAGFFTIRFDNRDVGLSTKCPDTPYGLSDMARDAVAVLDAAGSERAHVLGLSMGGMIAQTLAIEHPRRLLSMTSLMSTTGDPDVGQSSPEAAAVLFGPPPADRAGYVARQLAASRIWGSPASFDEARIVANAEAAFDRCFEPAGQARQVAAILGSGSRTEALRRVQVPTLVLHGDADTLVDPSGGRRTAEAVPGARFVLIEGLGHDYPPEHWERIVGLVADHARTAVARSDA
jgi:pimeloyl-ACP methyl ester carboxylesterase